MAHVEKQKSKRCKRCGTHTLHVKSLEKFNPAIGCLLTVVTCGLFGLLWPLIGAGNLSQPWRCQQCGKAYGRLLG